MKKILTIILLLTLMFALSAVSFADDSNTTTLEEQTTLNKIDIQEEEIIEAMGVNMGYQLYYEIINTTVSGPFFDSYRNGATAENPGTFSITQGASLNTGFTASISGSYPVGEGEISAAIGVEVGKTTYHEASYTAELTQAEYDDGKVKTIIFRPKYKIHQITNQFVQEDTTTGEKFILSTHNAYVKEFDGWSYGWVYGFGN